MEWVIENVNTHITLDQRFASKELAEARLDQMGKAFVNIFKAFPNTSNPWERRVLTEGLVKGDLRHIILPQISIDEYIPGDPGTDNIVIAFFIKGVPEAVIPFRDFIMKFPSVIDIAYGDSDTIPNTSIVYAEMSRKNFRFEALREIMTTISMLSELEIDDFSLMFPNKTNRIPYSEEALMDYFVSRTKKSNWQAQQKAIKQDDKRSPEERRESMVEHIVGLIS